MLHTLAALAIALLASAHPDPGAASVECFGDGSSTLLLVAETGEGGDAGELLAALATRYRGGEAPPAGAVLCFAGPVDDGPAAVELAAAAGADAVAWLRCCYDAVASNDVGDSADLGDRYREAGAFGYFFDSRPGGNAVLEALALDGVSAIAVDMASNTLAELDRHAAGIRAVLEALAAVE
jgi:hypothetical protein